MMLVRKNKSKVLFAVLGLILAPLLTVIAQQEPRRPLTPDDLFKLEEVGQVALSPDGQWLAYVIKRSKETARIHTRPFLEGNDRGDVWLVSTTGGKPRNLTNGLKDGSGWWAPAWSPDSRRLAMLSTRNGNVRLWMWEKATRRLKKLTERGVDSASLQHAPFAWLDHQQLVCIVLPDRQKPNAMTIEMRAAEIAMGEWPKAWRGQVTTASALESGIGTRLDERPQGQLLLIDVVKGSRQVATGFSFRELQVSPDQKHIAVLKQTDVMRPEPDKLLLHGRPAARYQAVVFSREGKQSLLEVAKIKDVQVRSLRWSLNGKSLALVGSIPSAGPRTVVCEIPQGKCQAIFPEQEPMATVWAKESTLLVMPKTSSGNRPDWWAVDAAGQRRNLTSQMKSVPRELLRENGDARFVGLADGELWRIRIDGGEPQNLTSDFEPRITSVIWPQPADIIVGQLVFAVRKGTGTEWYQVDLATGRKTLLSKPNPEAGVISSYPQHGIAILTARDRTGTYLWLTRSPFQQHTTIVETNTQLREVAQTNFKKIEYRSLDGRELKGWVLLPVGYQEGRKYPLITVAYAGNVFGDNPPGGHARNINNAGTLNYHLLAARGYAVLFPSIPLKPEGEASDPYLELTKGVLPAVDKVIELGIADPKRLGVMGQSYGGYATFGLIAQTNKFQAAVSLAGLSDLLSLYGILDARFRYDQFAHERLFSMSIAETGQVRMGNPPWKDFERYIRNSPLFHVDRIQTPLMIVQGDLDYIAMQQGEQIFTALHRQNRRSTFVRYWGEGHILESPANIRDLWNRVYEWFDTFLALQVTGGAHKTKAE